MWSYHGILKAYGICNRTRVPPVRPAGFRFMFWHRKTELEKQILEYNKDTDTLLEFARTSGKKRIEEVTIEDVKTFYKLIFEARTPFTALDYMKILRKFFREHRGENILDPKQIMDNPFDSVVRNDIIPRMSTVKKRGKGRPAQIDIIKKVISLREKEGLSFRAIARALDRDLGQVHVWYKRRDILLRSELSTDKLLA